MSVEVQTANRGRWFLSLLRGVLEGANGQTTETAATLRVLASQLHVQDVRDFPYAYVELTSSEHTRETVSALTQTNSEQLFFVAVGCQAKRNAGPTLQELEADAQDVVEGLFERGPLDGMSLEFERPNGSKYAVAIARVVFPLETARAIMDQGARGELVLSGKVVFNQTPVK